MADQCSSDKTQNASYKRIIVESSNIYVPTIIVFSLIGIMAIVKIATYTPYSTK